MGNILLRDFLYVLKNPKKSLNYFFKPKLMLNKLGKYIGYNWVFPDLELIVLYVNSTCNLKCKMCDIGQANGKGIDLLRKGQKHKLLSISLLNKILDDSYFKNKKITFDLLMTEPLMHPKIVDIIKMIKAKGHRVSMCTNGYLLPEKAKELAKSGLDLLRVSIDGPPQLHDNVRGIKGTYERAINGIKIINKESNIDVVINYAVIPMNDNCIIQFLETLSKEKVKISIANFALMDFVTEEMRDRHNKVCSYKQTESCINDELHPNNAHIEMLSKELRGIKNNYSNIKDIKIVPFITSEKDLSRFFNSKGLKIKRNDHCEFPWHQMAIATDGKVRIHMRCFDYVYGDVNKHSISKIFNNKGIKKFRQDFRRANYCFPACTRCCGAMTYNMGPKRLN